MNIRTKFTVLFSLAFAVILSFFSAVAYYTHHGYRKSMLNDRMEEKANSLADRISAGFPKNHIVRMADLSRESGLQVIILDSSAREWIPAPFKILDSASLGSLIASDTDTCRYQVIAGKEVISRKANSAAGVIHIMVVSANHSHGPSEGGIGSFLALGFFAAMAFAVLAAWLYAGQSLRLVSGFIEDVDGINAANLRQRLTEIPGNDEKSRMVRSFNRLLAVLETSFELQNVFVVNASKKLRMPLSAMVIKIEIIMLRERSQEQYRVLVSSLLNDIRNLASLANGLLEMASTIFEFNPSLNGKLQVDELVWEMYERMRDKYPHYAITVEFNGMEQWDEHKLTVSGNRYMLISAFSAIADNACRYSSDHACNVTISLSKEDIVIEFRDQGIGITSDEMPRVFEPFYRSTRVSDDQGNGLGLTLAESVLRFHKGSIRIDSVAEKGTCVTLSFKSA